MTTSSDAVVWLSADSPNLDEMLPKVMALSNDIFTPEPGTKYASMVHWREHLSRPPAAIAFLSSNQDDAMPYAYLFAYPRDHAQPLSNGSSESTHIWLAGVSPSHRRTGALQRMMDSLLSRHTGVFTICTIPSRFPDMWQWLNKRGWAVEGELDGGRILLSKRI